MFLYETKNIALPAITALLLSIYNGADASCIASCDYLEADTLSDGIVEIRCMRDTGAVSIDTSSRADMIGTMTSLFDSVAYCFIGTIDTVREFFLPPDSQNTRYDADSVRIVVDTCLKGNIAENDLWGVDDGRYPKQVIDSSGNSYELDISLSSGGYRSLIGRRIVFFADTLRDITTWGIRPAGGCESDANGYLIDEEHRIHNPAGFPFLDVSLREALDAFDTTLRAGNGFQRNGSPGAPRNHGLHRLVCSEGTPIPAGPHLCVYTLTGRRVSLQASRANNTSGSVTGGIADGVYLLGSRESTRRNSRAPAPGTRD